MIAAANKYWFSKICQPLTNISYLQSYPALVESVDKISRYANDVEIRLDIFYKFELRFIVMQVSYVEDFHWEFSLIFIKILILHRFITISQAYPTKTLKRHIEI